MKRFICLILAFALALSLAACGTFSNTENTTDGDTNISNKEVSNADTNVVGDVTTPGANKMDAQDGSGDNAIQGSVEPELAHNGISFGELISLDFVEFTIEGASSGDEIRPDNPNGVYRYMSDQADEKYVYLYGTIKNVSGDMYEFADNMYAKMTFDGKYNYNASIRAVEGGDFSYIYAYLDPLKSEKFYISASIPDELVDQYQEVVVTFGFAENFDGVYREDDCDYLYSVTVTK